MDKYKVTYTAGGATQNSIRVAQWLLPPGSTVYIGSVGADDNAQILKSAAEKDGVLTQYQTTADFPTGRCAVLIKDTERSLVTDLAAAGHYSLQHLTQPDTAAVVERARYFYSAGYFLTVSPPSLMHLASHCLSHPEKQLMGNISAPFIAQFFTQPLLDALPYFSFLFGNESEAVALGTKLGVASLAVPDIARHLAALPKVTPGERTVVITQGSGPTVVSVGGRQCTEHAVQPIARERIVDLNGAGDAFVGGFVSQLVQGKPMDQCVQAGHYAAGTIIQVSGIVLNNKPDKFV